MADQPIRTACPQCDCRVNGTDRKLVGKKIRCPRCKQPFTVEPLTEDAPAESERAPRKLKRNKQQRGSILPIALIGGGVLAVLVFVGVGIMFFGKGLLSNMSGGSGGPGLFSGNLPGASELSGDLAGPWPEPPRMPALNITPDNSITVHVLLENESYRLSMQENGNDVKKVRDTLGGREDAIKDRLSALIHCGSLGGMDDAPSGRARRMNLVFGPTTEDPSAFAKKIDFGSVRSVNGRVITLVVKKGEGPKPAAKQ
ncbi:MAG TPA: hypothetical protein VGZ47_10685 [Gemmataceae bacterium]|jgi:hypothetical protein|nr:hypothetical protein [Gemmataceae bacterium]